MENPRIRILGAALGVALLATACDRQADTTAAPQGDPPANPAAAAPTGVPGAVPPPVSPAGPVAGAEREFVAQAASSGLAEIEASRMIADQARSDAVKTFAETLEREHSSALDELKRIATEKDIDLPASVEGEPRERLNQLSAAPKDAIERDFVQEFGVDAHEKSIALFERQAREGQDPELKAYAERTLPKLREHLSMARQLHEELGGG